MARDDEQPAISYRWDKSPAVASAVADFAGRIVGAQAAYISHGEIQTGLSLDGARWAPNLPELYAEDFAELGEERDLLVAETADGVLAGFAIVAWEATPRRRFAVLEDMAVEPTLRSHGVGAGLVSRIEQAVAARGIEWLFLESGLGNAGAHRFFEREGFAQLSHVFGKRVEAP